MSGREGIRERRRKRQTKRRLMFRQNSIRRLPKEILENIFHRLPLKPIHRLRVICKDWNSIISDPKFIDDDFRSRSSSNTHMVLSVYHIYYNYTRYHDDDDEDEDYGHEPKHKPIYTLDFSGGSTLLPTVTSRSKDADNWFGYKNPTILGSYNGLVALACNYDKYVLWNPLTRKYKSFPGGFAGAAGSYNFGARVLFGLCYDDSCDEYTVVVTAEYQSPPTSPTEFDCTIYYEGSSSQLTNLSTGLIKRSINGSALGRLLDRSLFEGGIGKVICGYPHWLLSFYDFKKPVLQREIFYFDFKDDVYKQLERPSEAIGEDKTMVGLAALGSELELGMILHDIPSSSLEVWVMKEYGNVESWTKLFVISTLIDHIPKFNHMEMLGYLPTGEILIDVDLKEFWAYDLVSGNARLIRLGGGGTGREKYTALLCYYPSFVSPSRLDPMIKRKGSLGKKRARLIGDEN